MTNSILLVGNVLVDVFSLPGEKEKRLRFGGIIHAARALWGLGVEYHVAYIAPTYLHDELEQYLASHGVGGIKCIGEVTGAPNTILIGDPTEAGDQGYEVLLREIKQVTLLQENLNELLGSCTFTDILMFPEASDPSELIEMLNDHNSSTLHIDANNLPELINTKGRSGKISVGSLFLSTSSCFFYPEYIGIHKLLENVFSFCEELILKENRGGTRAFTDQGEKVVSIPSFPRKIVHSVGVGDAFDATYLAKKEKSLDEVALRTSSLIAACYAATTFVDDMKDDMQRSLAIPHEEIINLRGNCLTWDERRDINIYLAGPDFDYIEKSELNHLVECLQYHNFNVRLPIRENGQATNNSSRTEKRRLFNADMKIMDECSLLIAVMLFNDQGTLVEIGIAKERNMPVIVYDPRDMVDNLFLEMVPNIITSTPNETIEAVFSIFGSKGEK